LLKGGAGSLGDYKIETPLTGILSKTDYDFVKADFEYYLHQSLENYNDYSPLLIMEMITKAKKERRTQPGDKKQTPMDAYFQAVAVMDGKPNIGLETAEEFRRISQSMPLPSQAFLLLYQLELTPEEEARRLDQPMRHCYQLQDLDCFCKIEDMAHYTRPGDSTMVVKRNLLWMTKLPGILERHPAFIAVGAAHLYGEMGLVALLRKQEFTVVPLRYD